jgi:hypothetical protein
MKEVDINSETRRVPGPHKRVPEPQMGLEEIDIRHSETSTLDYVIQKWSKFVVFCLSLDAPTHQPWEEYALLYES